MASEIPGLVSIEDQTLADGSCLLTFQIDDSLVDDFYGAFGLVTGDVAGFRSTVISALESYLAAHGALNDKSTG